MEFCALSQKHFDQVIDMVDSAEALYAFYPNGTYPLDHAQLNHLLKVRSNFTALLEAGQLLAMANLYDVEKNDKAFVGNVLVAQSQRGKGLGKKIMEYMCELCQSEHNAVPHLSVFNFNTKAMLLYSNMGFKPYDMEARKDVNQQDVALIHMKLEHG